MNQFIEFLMDIVEERNGFVLGNVWKSSKNAIGAIVPILRRDSPERDYVTLPEVKDQVRITDTGSIDGVRIKGTDKPVLVVAGSVLGGQGTQSRAVEHSVMVMPEEVIEVGVKCVHASHPISQGSTFRYEGVAPMTVTRSLLVGSQSKVWSSVRARYGSVRAMCSSMASSPTVASSRLSTLPGDDLVRIKRVARKIDSKIRELLENIPCLENQVGAVIISIKGIEGIEVYDHPDSWIAHYKEVIEKYSDSVVEESPLFKLDESEVRNAVKEFLRKLAEHELKQIKSNGYSVSMISGEYLGEVISFNGRIVHLFAMKSQEEDVAGDTAIIRSQVSTDEGLSRTMSNVGSQVNVTYSLSPSPLITHSDSNLIKFFEDYVNRRKGFKEVLRSIKNEGSTWSELKRGMKISSATLSSRLKEAKKLGFVEEGIRKNGKKVYKLTPMAEWLR